MVIVDSKKQRRPSIKRPERICQLIGKCTIDELDALASLLVQRKRAIAVALSNMLDDARANRGVTNSAPPSLPKTEDQTINIGGIEIPATVTRR